MVDIEEGGVNKEVEEFDALVFGVEVITCFSFLEDVEELTAADGVVKAGGGGDEVRGWRLGFYVGCRII
ncbi:hypothetical protein AGMMS49921_10420 [Endomicrobiia bacterium]|nr:hypothetical protein AGMMS49921_10420 [Endomicrobiia bacterium]